MNNQLSHHGVLGMRWGIRKDRRTGQRRPTSEVLADMKKRRRAANEVKNPSKDHQRKQELIGKKVAEMSNDEIRELTNRLQLERQLKDLNKVQVNKGRKIAEEVLINVAKQTAQAYLGKMSTQLLASMVENRK